MHPSIRRLSTPPALEGGGRLDRIINPEPSNSMKSQFTPGQNTNPVQGGARDLNQGGNFPPDAPPPPQRRDAGTLYGSHRGVTTDREPDPGLRREDAFSGGFTNQQQQQPSDLETERERARVAQTDLGAAGGAASRWSTEQELARQKADPALPHQQQRTTVPAPDVREPVSPPETVRIHRSPEQAPIDRDAGLYSESGRDSLNLPGEQNISADYNRERADVFNEDLEDRHDANRDPITGTPGSHPVGTGIGAASAGAVGAAIGAAGGPVGMAIGAAVGAVVGGLAGKATAEAVNPTEYDETYWRNTHVTEPHYDEDYAFDDYDPAYRYGTSAADTYRGRRFEDVEQDLSRGWETAKGKSRLGWEKAKGAVRSAWDRAERAIPGDSDGDGR